MLTKRRSGSGPRSWTTRRRRPSGRTRSSMRMLAQPEGRVPAAERPGEVPPHPAVSPVRTCSPPVRSGVQRKGALGTCARPGPFSSCARPFLQYDGVRPWSSPTPGALIRGSVLHLCAAYTACRQSLARPLLSNTRTLSTCTAFIIHALVCSPAQHCIIAAQHIHASQRLTHTEGASSVDAAGANARPARRCALTLSRSSCSRLVTPACSPSVRGGSPSPAVPARRTGTIWEISARAVDSGC